LPTILANEFLWLLKPGYLDVLTSNIFARYSHKNLLTLT